MKKFLVFQILILSITILAALLLTSCLSLDTYSNQPESFSS
ncbi:hypothetical protein [Treponema putidum]|nr:hypothetical protein JM98_01583 [Treponema putidum]